MIYGRRVPFRNYSREKGSEKKSYEFAGSGAVINTGSNLLTTLVGGITPGTGDNNRVGRKILVKNIRIKGFFQVDAGAYANTCYRIIMFLDTQCNNAGAVLSDVMYKLQPADTNTDSISFQNLYKQSRFNILYDKMKATPVSSWNGSTFPVIQVPFKINKNVNIPIVYNGTAGTVADLPQNNIGLMGWSERAATMFYNVRIRYIG